MKLREKLTMSKFQPGEKPTCFLERIGNVNGEISKQYFITAVAAATAFVETMERHPKDDLMLCTCDGYEEDTYLDDKDNPLKEIPAKDLPIVVVSTVEAEA